MQTRFRRVVGVAGLVLALAASATWAMAAGAPKLRYDFQAGKQYAYEIKIEAELEDTIENRDGISTYAVLSADDKQMVLRQSGSLGERSRPRPSADIMGPPGFPGPRGFPGPHGFPGFGPSGPAGITFDRQGGVVLSKPLTHLPYLLGDLETLPIEELPAEAKMSWQRQRDVLAVESRASGFPRFGPFRGGTQSERPAKEQIDYAVIDVRPEAVRVKKTYSFRTAPEGNQADSVVRFDMSGSGEFTFDLKQGVIGSLAMKYKININEPNKTLRVPVTLSCRLMTAEELAAHKKKQEDARIAAKEAAAPKPLDAAERARLLTDLASADDNRQKAAANRLAKAVVDDDPAPIAKALLPLLRSSDHWVQSAAAKALTVWCTPEAEEALIEASTSEDHWVRVAAIESLGKLKSAKAAEAVAAQMYRSRHEAGAALKAMGPVAEAATIGCLKDRDGWVRKEACQILGEIGGQESLKALKPYAQRATGFDRHDANRAIEAIERRIQRGTTDAGDKKADADAKGGKLAFRTWRDASGVFEIEAVMIGVKDGKVTLKKRNGRQIVLPLARLSSEDQSYVAKHSQEK
jgi:HEAT repeat protein